VKGLPGELVSGRYKIDHTIGTGGFGTVYSGRQINLDRQVAVKVMRQGPESPEVSRERFRREAVLTSTLNHPHIVTLHDFLVDDDGDMLLVMEYLDGATLDQLTARHGRLDAGRVAKLAVEAARGLAESHRAGIIHRDIKPSNIFVVEPSTSRERAKVIDFGILCVDPEIRESLPELTRENAFIGTPEYVAPEILIGGQPDGRTDQYALALVVIKAVTGEKPFNSSSDRALLQRLAMRPPLLDSGVFDRQAALKGVLYKALSPHPGDRFEDMDQFADAVVAAMSGAGPSVGAVEHDVTERVARGTVGQSEVAESVDETKPSLRLSAVGAPLVNVESDVTDRRSVAERSGPDRIWAIRGHGLEITFGVVAVAVAVAGWVYVNREEPPPLSTRRVVVQQVEVPAQKAEVPAKQVEVQEQKVEVPAQKVEVPVDVAAPVKDGVAVVAAPEKVASKPAVSKTVASKPAASKKSAIEFTPDQRGTLTVQADPWALIFIDGRAMGRTPINQVELSAGTHTVVFRHDTLGEMTRIIKIAPGSAVKEFVEFD
jgi:serine/threonine-protein kinase